jgi:hypothetical protein
MMVEDKSVAAEQRLLAAMAAGPAADAGKGRRTLKEPGQRRTTNDSALRDQLALDEQAAELSAATRAQRGKFGLDMQRRAEAQAKANERWSQQTGLAMADAEREKALSAYRDVSQKFQEFQANLLGKSEGMSLLERLMPDTQFDRVTAGLQRLTEQSSETGNALVQISDAAAGAFGAAGNALWDLVSGEKSAGDAFRDAFRDWLSTWGKRMQLRALEAGAEALFQAAIFNWPGAAKAAAAAIGFGAAAMAAGLGARALAPSKKAETGSRGVDRGLGGPSSGGARERASATFVYNINTLVPPDETEAARFVASSLNVAKAMGYA